MQRTITFALLFVLAVCLSGCGASLEKAIIGKYTLDIDSSAMEEKDKSMMKLAESFIKGISIEFKEGGKVAMVAGNDSQEGTWKLDGTTLTVTDAKGKAEKLEVKDGGKTLVPDPSTMGMNDMKGAKLTFKKSE